MKESRKSRLELQERSRESGKLDKEFTEVMSETPEQNEENNEQKPQEDA